MDQVGFVDAFRLKLGAQSERVASHRLMALEDRPSFRYFVLQALSLSKSKASLWGCYDINRGAWARLKWGFVLG